MSRRPLSHLGDGTLRRQLDSLAATDRKTTADLLAHLAEFETRRLFAQDGFPSLFAYCVNRLRFSEDMAFKRIRVARAARRFPALLDAIADGRLHLSGAVLLVPSLKPENFQELLAAATHKTKAEIELLLAHRFPQPDVPTRVRAIPAPPLVAPAVQVAPGPVVLAPTSTSRSQEVGVAPPPSVTAPVQVVPGPVGQAPAGLAAVQGNPVAPLPAVAAPASRVTPLAPGRFAFQTTIGQGTHDKLRQLQDLLGPQVPSGDVAQILDRAFDALLEKLQKSKHAAAGRSRRGPNRPSNDPRHIPAQIKQQVWKRDGGRCTFVSDSDQRCMGTRFLEYDHIQEVARGGESTIGNLRLRCRAHNQLTAEQTFGVEFMRARREAAQLRAGVAGGAFLTRPG